MDAPFPWGLAIGVAVGLGLVGAVLSPITVFLVGLSLPVAVLGVSVSAVICFRRGARSPRADAVGFGIALAPLLSVLPLLGLVLAQWPS